MKNIIFMIKMMAAVFVMAGCFSHQRQYQGEGLNANRLGLIAILPLENFTEYPNAGDIVRDLMETELMAQGSHEIMSGNEMKRILKEKEVDLIEILEKRKLQEVGRFLEVDTVLYGSVTEYRYKRGLSGDPAVGLHAEAVIVETGEVVWSVTQSKTSVSQWYALKTINQLAQEACEKMLSTLQ